MKTLILDWSGTLVDDFTPTLYATNVVLKEYGLPEYTANQFRESFYLPYPDFYKEILPDVPLAELEIIFRKAFIECPQPVSLLTPSLNFLKWASENHIRLIILTSMDSVNFESQAKKFEVYSLFEAVYSGVLNKCETIPEIIKAHQLKPSETMFIGDMEHDIHAAHIVGILSGAVLTGYDSAEKLIKCDPTVVLNDIGKLRPIIEGCR